MPIDGLGQRRIEAFQPVRQSLRTVGLDDHVQVVALDGERAHAKVLATPEVLAEALADRFGQVLPSQAGHAAAHLERHVDRRARYVSLAPSVGHPATLLPAGTL